MKLMAMMLAFGLLALIAVAQAPTDQKPKFEMVIVKPVKAMGSLRISPDGEIVYSGTTVKTVLISAYRLRSDQILRAPAWTDTEFWAIQAKGPAWVNNVPQPDVQAQMLQSFLEDRFKLKVHYETKEFSVYSLKVGGGASGMKPFEDQGWPPRIVPGEPFPGSIRRTADDLVATGVLVSSFIKYLGQILGSPVLDNTGLDGKFSFVLHGLPPAVGSNGLGASNDDKSRSLIFKAIEDIGLKLELTKSSLEVLVIDSVKKPSED